MRRIHGIALAMSLLCAFIPSNGAAQTPDFDRGEVPAWEKSPTISDDGKLVDGKSVAEWIKQYRTGKVEERKAALYALLQLARGDSAAIHELVAGLADKDAELRSLAYRCLHNLDPDDKLIRALAGGLDASEPLEVRRGVATILCSFERLPEMKAAAPALCASLKDGDAWVRVSAARTLWRVDPLAGDLVPIFLGALEDLNEGVRIAGFGGLEMMGPSAVAAAPVLAKKLRAEDSDDCGFAALALARIGKEAVPTLILSLGSESKTVRRASARVLGRIGADAEAAVPALHGAILDEDLDARLTAAEALWSIEEKPATVVAVFLDAYQHGKPDERCRAVDFFKSAWPKSAEALAGYLRAMKDPDERVRRTAIEVGWVDVLRLPDALLRALVESLEDEDNGNAGLAFERLSFVRSAAFPYLLPVTREGAPFARRSALSLLVTDADHEDEVAAVCLRVLREDAASTVRCAAARKLGQCGDANKKALAELLLALRDIDPHVRSQVAEILSSFETDGDVIAAALLERLHDPACVVRLQAARGLGKLRRNPQDTVPALIGALKDSDENVSRAAGISLGEFGPQANAAIPHLIARLGHEQAPRLTEAPFAPGIYPGEWAAEALGRIGSGAVPALAEALTHEKARVRVQAALALERIGPESREAIPQLKKLLSDPERQVRIQAIKALKAIDPELAKKLLVS